MPCLGHAYPITILEIQNLYSKNVYIAPTYRNLNGVYFQIVNGLHLISYNSKQIAHVQAGCSSIFMGQRVHKEGNRVQNSRI